jgi:hypothetical protein
LTNIPFTVLVNTSDSYSDCWAPFFTLFSRYWPENSAPVILNTERADYTFPGIALSTSRVQEGIAERLPWSDCLLACLDRVETPLVLYLQEDYFLEEQVDDARIRRLADRMLDRPDIRHLGLTAFGAYGPFAPSDEPDLWVIDRRSRYRISCQAALWRVDTLRSYLRPGENGWMFEIYGSRRSRRRDELFLTVDRDRERERRTFPYSHAGIIKGQWHQSVPALFARNGIAVDFSKRGMFEPRSRLVEKSRTFKKLLADPVGLVRGMAGY